MRRAVFAGLITLAVGSGGSVAHAAAGDACTAVQLSDLGPGSWADAPVATPDGSRIFFTGDDGSGYGIYTADPDGSNRALIVPDASWVEVSPDGTRIAYIADSLFVANLDGSNAILVSGSTGNIDAPLSFSPDGTAITFAAQPSAGCCPHRAYVGNTLAGGEPLQVSPTAFNFENAIFPAFTPDGSQIIFGGPGVPGSYGVWLVNADGSGGEVQVHDGSVFAQAGPFSFAPDGSRFYFRGFTSGFESSDIYSMTLDGATIENLTNDPDLQKSWAVASPDGSVVVFQRPGKIEQVTTDTHVTSVAVTGAEVGFAYSSDIFLPDGGFVFSGWIFPICGEESASNIFRAECGEADGDGDGVTGQIDNCTALPNPDQTDTDGDGRGDPCDRCPSDPFDNLDTDGICGDADNCPAVANDDQADSDEDGIGDACEALCSVEQLIPGGYFSNIVASPDGTRIAFDGDDGTAYGVFIANPDGTDRVLVAAEASSPLFSPDGTKLAYVVNQGGLFVANSDGTDPVLVSGATGNVGAPYAFSPDGARIAFSAQPTAGCCFHRIYLGFLGGGTPVQLTSFNENSFFPAFTPDGAQLLTLGPGTSSSYGIWLVEVDGGGAVQLDAGSFGTPGPFSVSPDGSTFYFHGYNSTYSESDLFAMTLDGSTLVNLTNDPELSEYGTALSPDGSRLLFGRDEHLELLDVATLATGVAAFGSAAYGVGGQLWAPDGSGFYYAGSGECGDTQNVVFATACSGGAPPPPPAGLMITCAPEALTIRQGENAALSCTITSIDGFTGEATPSCDDLPDGVGCAFYPESVELGEGASASVNVTVIASEVAQVGAGQSFDVRVEGGDASAGTTIALTLPPCSPASTPEITSPANGETGVAASPSLTWSPSLNAVNYSVQLAADPGFSTPLRSGSVTGATFEITPPLQAGLTYYWRVAANTVCGTRSGATVNSFTVGTSPPNLVLNPGFEDGLVDWIIGGAASITNSTSNAPYSGSWYAQLGGVDGSISNLYQSVTIPSGAATAYFQYRVRIATSESGPACRDTMSAEIRDAATFTLLASQSACNSTGQTDAWRGGGPIDLTAFAGRTVLVRFFAITDAANPTSFFIDDVTLAAE